MPTLAVERDALFHHLKRTYSDESFDELCFEFGVELDEITSEVEEAQKSSTVKLTKKELEKLSSDVIYKIDVPANRYDLLCLEGLSRALRIFLGEEEGGSPTYRLSNVPSTAASSAAAAAAAGVGVGGGGVGDAGDDTTIRESITVMPKCSQIRPFVVCGILRDIKFTPTSYKSFIELQDQLHRNLCRNRTLVAIGTHDYDMIQGPFKYDACTPDSIEFVPLTPDDKGPFKANELMKHYENDPECKHLKPYVPIIVDSPVYPVIYDVNDVVLSLPPIINGSKSKITLDTTNVFIECTATDLTKANVVLDTICCMFSEYCAEPHKYCVEPVEVIYVDEDAVPYHQYVTPKLECRTLDVNVDFVNSLIGIQLSGEEMVHLCNKVQLGPALFYFDNNKGKKKKSEDDDDGDGDGDGEEKEVSDDGGTLTVTIPPTRSDILHAVDVAEDIGIAYGYNKIVKRIPKTCTVGGEQPLNLLTDLLRDEISRAGYIEVLTHGLSSIHDNFTALQNPIQMNRAVSLSNPANVEYQVVRTTLLTGLLKTLQHNKSASFTKDGGFKLFEISDVVLQDSSNIICHSVVGAKNVRRICAIYSGSTSGFEIIHGLVDRIMTLCEVKPEDEYIKASAKGKEEEYRVSKDGWVYTIRENVVEEEEEEEEEEEMKKKSADPGGDDDQEGGKGATAALSTNTTTTTIGTYFPGRSASILLKSPKLDDSNTWTKIGTFGILHPQVLSNFDIQYPSSSIEMDLEPLLH